MALHTWKTEKFHHDHHTNRPGTAVNALLPASETIAKRLIARHETIATAESSTGGLIAAALLATRKGYLRSETALLILGRGTEHQPDAMVRIAVRAQSTTT